MNFVICAGITIKYQIDFICMNKDDDWTPFKWKPYGGPYNDQTKELCDHCQGTSVCQFEPEEDDDLRICEICEGDYHCKVCDGTGLVDV